MLLEKTELDNLKTFIVIDEKGGENWQLATDPDDAIESFYDSIKSICGHTWKICSCFGPEKPLDRTKVIRPYEVRDQEGNVLKRITMADFERIERVQK